MLKQPGRSLLRVALEPTNLTRRWSQRKAEVEAAATEEDDDDDEVAARKRQEKEAKRLARQLKEAQVASKIHSLRLRAVSTERMDEWTPLRVRKAGWSNMTQKLTTCTADQQSHATNGNDGADRTWGDGCFRRCRVRE